jgi:hypothetical protein
MGRIATEKVALAVMIISFILGSLESISIGLGSNPFTYGMDIFAISPYLTEDMKLEQLTWEDAKAISKIPGVTSVDTVKRFTTKVFFGDKEEPMNITEITPNFFQITGRMVELGRGFNSLDFQKFQKVAIIPESSKNVLFSDGVNPIGSEIYINRESFIVVGIISQAFIEEIVNRYKVLRDYLPMISQLADLIYPKREIVIPLFYNPEEKLDAIIVKVRQEFSWGTLKAVLKDEIVRTLRFRHLQESDYEVFNVHERLMTLKVYLGIFIIVLAIISVLLIWSGLRVVRKLNNKWKPLVLGISIGEIASLVISRIITLRLDLPPSPLWVFLIGLFILPYIMVGKNETNL